MPVKFFSTIVRLESTQSWRPRLWEAHARYQAASTRCRRLEGIEPECQIRNLEHVLAIARRVELEALMHYVRLIKIGTVLRAQRLKRDLR
jgi:hypothetical protein